MKKLLSTISSVLLLCSTNVGYTTHNDIELNDLPDSSKREFARYLMPNEIAQLAQVNHSFHANMAVVVNKMISEIAQQLGLNFEVITPFCKNFLMNVKTGNFNLTKVRHKIEGITIQPEPMIIYGGGYYGLQKANIRSLTNDGHINTKELSDDSLDIKEGITLKGANHDATIFVGSHQKKIQYDSEDSNASDHGQKWQTVPVKYMTATNTFNDLLPNDIMWNYVACGLNSDASIVVGNKTSNLFAVTFEDIKEDYGAIGFVSKNDGSVTYLPEDQPRPWQQVYAVSDKGEIVVGQANLRKKDEHGIYTGAAVWLKDGTDRYHRCFLLDLLMHNCTNAQRAVLQEDHLREIAAVSPNGNAMYVNIKNPRDASVSYLTVRFGSKIAPEM